MWMWLCSQCVHAHANSYIINWVLYLKRKLDMDQMLVRNKQHLFESLLFSYHGWRLRKWGQGCRQPKATNRLAPLDWQRCLSHLLYVSVSHPNIKDMFWLYWIGRSRADRIGCDKQQRLAGCWVVGHFLFDLFDNNNKKIYTFLCTFWFRERSVKPFNPEASSLWKTMCR